jgi:acyl-[acyl-carrier-protein]-phospholipid O-acyltransferase/long-chain-fatty-acid--[acyl-carrier-protein] ligase
MRQDKRSLVALLVAQFLGAANDNFLKGIVTFMLVTGIWAGHLGEGGQSYANFAFSLPFVLFSGIGGQVADRYSKTSLARWLKKIEVPIAVLAGIALWQGSLGLAFFSLTAMATHSAFFGPVKWGLLPDLVGPFYLTRANGYMNMLTNIAAILAMVAAGSVADLLVSKEAPTSVVPQHFLPLLVMTVLAFFGLAAILFVRRLPRPGILPPYELNPFRTYFETLREMAKGPLLDVVGAWAYFYLIAQVALTMIPEYAIVLQISNTKASYLLATIAVSIGVGSVAVGLISKGRVSARYVPFGALGMTLGFIGLAVVPPTFANVLIFLAAAGFAAGFYVVPLQALMQRLSPTSQRGVFLGTANALCFAAFFGGSAVYKVIRPYLGAAPQQSFYACAFLVTIGLAFFWLRLGRAAIFRSF